MEQEQRADAEQRHGGVMDVVQRRGHPQERHQREDDQHAPLGSGERPHAVELGLGHLDGARRVRHLGRIQAVHEEPDGDEAHDPGTIAPASQRP